MLVGNYFILVSHDKGVSFRFNAIRNSAALGERRDRASANLISVPVLYFMRMGYCWRVSLTGLLTKVVRLFFRYTRDLWRLNASNIFPFKVASSFV